MRLLCPKDGKRTIQKTSFLEHKQRITVIRSKLRLCALGLGIAPIDRSRESEWPSVGKSPLGKSVGEKNRKNVLNFRPYNMKEGIPSYLVYR